MSTLAAEINRLAERHSGTLTPELVVEAAADPQSPLHGWFQWDDEAAAHQHRLDQARQLIRIVRVEIQTTTLTVSAPAYVRDPMLDGQYQGYRSTVSLIDDETAVMQALLAEVVRLRGIIERTRALAVAWGKQEAAEDMIRGALD